MHAEDWIQLGIFIIGLLSLAVAVYRWLSGIDSKLAKICTTLSHDARDLKQHKAENQREHDALWGRVNENTAGLSETKDRVGKLEGKLGHEHG